jgi:hypothetical protein
MGLQTTGDGKKIKTDKKINPTKFKTKVMALLSKSNEFQHGMGAAVVIVGRYSR